MSFIKNYVNADGRSSRRRIFILSISLILLTALISGLVIAGILVHRSNSGEAPHQTPASTADAIRSICTVTLYPQSCFSTLISAGSSDPEKLFQYLVTAAIGALESISNFPEAYAKKADDNKLAKEALKVCGDLLSDAAESLNDTLSSARLESSSTVIDDLMTWLSAAMTDLETCLDALEEASVDFAGEIQLLMRNSTELASNSLAIVVKLLAAIGDLRAPFHRRLLADEFPAWLAEDDRRILEGTTPKPHFTVAKDGSGNFKTLAEAVKKIPVESEERIVIYVKGGNYSETVRLSKKHQNVMMYGDRNGTKTVITGNLSFIEGTPTFETPTFAVQGQGFFAQDIVFENTAGPAGHQAVAMRSQSDFSVFYRCTFLAFQDTLYPHSKRQFYRECDITGTVDFIFGNAAVVFQYCNIMPREPMKNQLITITAQGKKDPNQKTGISILKCVVKPYYMGENITAETYLGRPWKIYSTTVFMKTEIGGLVNPAGWIAWDASLPLPNTTFYGEYKNTGDGANTTHRVRWPGYVPELSLTNASLYTVDKFIDGKVWLNATGVPYDPSL